MEAATSVQSSLIGGGVGGSGKKVLMLAKTAPIMSKIIHKYETGKKAIAGSKLLSKSTLMPKLLYLAASIGEWQYGNQQNLLKTSPAGLSSSQTDIAGLLGFCVAKEPTTSCAMPPNALAHKNALYNLARWIVLYNSLLPGLLLGTIRSSLSSPIPSE